MTEECRELYKVLNQAVHQFDYLLLAVAASAIALAVNDTRQARLTYDMLPLGVAVCLWGLSFFAGCRRQVFVIATYKANLQSMSAKDGHAKMQFDALFDVKNAKANCWWKWQFRFFVAGALAYLFWHVTEMWLRTFPTATSQPVA